MDWETFSEELSRVGDECRSEYHVTLRELIHVLENANPNDKIAEMDIKHGDHVFYDYEFDSYRGYYSDLVLIRSNINDYDDDLLTVEKLLTLARRANGGTFYGYKGGEFKMGLKTPLWVADDQSNASQVAVIDIATDEGICVLDHKTNIGDI